MKPFNPEFTCPKCGWIYYSTEFHKQAYDLIGTPFGPQERLKITCNRCGYKEDVRPLDAELEEGELE